MALSKEFAEQIAAIRRVAEDAAELKAGTKLAAILAVQAQMLHLLARKGIISQQDISDFLTQTENAAVAISKSSPDTAQEMANIALQLRHALGQSGSTGH